LAGPPCNELDWIGSRLIARDQNHGVVIVEFDIDRAHLALGVVDLVDALLLLLDGFIAAATERAEGLLDLGG